MAGRKKLAPMQQHGPEFVGATPSAMAKAEAAAHMSGELVSAEQVAAWMSVSRLSGQASAAGFLATVAGRLFCDTYKNIKKTKSYVGLQYTDPDGNLRHVAGLEDFCPAFLGKSYRRCEEILANSEMLGDLYEQAQKIGLTQRDYNAIKALPADDQRVVQQALSQGADRETVVESLVSLVERQVAQKQRLADERDKAIEQSESVRADLANRDAEIGELKQKVSKAQRSWVAMSPDEQLKVLQQAVNVASVSVRAAIGTRGGEGGLGNAVRALCKHAEEHDLEVGDYLGGVFREIETLLHILRDDPELGLPIPILTAQIG